MGCFEICILFSYLMYFYLDIELVCLYVKAWVFQLTHFRCKNNTSPIQQYIINRRISVLTRQIQPPLLSLPDRDKETPVNDFGSFNWKTPWRMLTLREDNSQSVFIQNCAKTRSSNSTETLCALCVEYPLNQGFIHPCISHWLDITNRLSRIDPSTI